MLGVPFSVILLIAECLYADCGRAVVWESTVSAVTAIATCVFVKTLPV